MSDGYVGDVGESINRVANAINNQTCAKLLQFAFKNSLPADAVMKQFLEMKLALNALKVKGK
jgi:hypothetical protein